MVIRIDGGRAPAAPVLSPTSRARSSNSSASCAVRGSATLVDGAGPDGVSHPGEIVQGSSEGLFVRLR